MEPKKVKNYRRKLIILITAVFLAVAAVFAFYTYTTPKITLKGDKVMEVTMAEGYKEPGATAKFSFKDISKYIKIDSNVNDKKVGIYEVLYSVNYLDKKATALRTVSVIDKEPPEITLLNGDSVSIRTGEKFEEPGYTATDNSDGNVTAMVQSKGFVDRYNEGDYEIEYRVSDSYDNEAKAVRTVTVKGEPVKKIAGVIYLTFDDGPSNKVTPDIVNILEEYDVPATFFVVDYGQDEGKIKTMKRAINNGCTIGIHGYSHDYSRIYRSVPDFMENVSMLDEKLKRDLDYDAFVMRFPGGSSNTVSKSFSEGIMTKLVKEIQKEGYMYNDWNVDSKDASGNNVSADILVRAVKRSCKKDTFNVVLMHDSDTKGTTAEALPEIIKWGKREGYTFRAITVDSPTIHHDVNN
ncbi:MAG: immunoglobulin-like domain-containing protein [Lentihominibacter sp.]|jgi:peptidoglycan/xylan/chitin deacetylase (PgdA/CDA1 family)